MDGLDYKVSPALGLLEVCARRPARPRMVAIAQRFRPRPLAHSFANACRMCSSAVHTGPPAGEAP